MQSIVLVNYVVGLVITQPVMEENIASSTPITLIHNPNLNIASSTSILETMFKYKYIKTNKQTKASPRQ